MNRGDRREAIFVDDEDRERLLQTLTQACAKTGWQVHAYCLMRNHFHLVIETPQPNLVVGMKWLLGTYTSRYNRRHIKGSVNEIVISVDFHWTQEKEGICLESCGSHRLELLAENMTISLTDEFREKASDLIGAELLRGSAVNKGLKLPHPEAVGSEGFPGVVPERDSSLQVAVFLLPRGTPSRNRPRGAGWVGAWGQAGVGRERGRHGLGRRDWSRLGRHWPGRKRRALPAWNRWRGG